MAATQVFCPAWLTKIVFVLLSAVCVVYGGAGEYIVTHTPSHVAFQPATKHILNSEVSQVIATTFGFTVNKDLEWDGLGQTSLFARPKANVLVSIEGIPRSLNIKHHRKYEAVNDDVAVSTGSVADHLLTNMPAEPLVVDFSTDNSLFSVREEHPEIFSRLPATLSELRKVLAAEKGIIDTGVLNATHEADLLFLGEMHTISGIIHGLRQHPDLVKDATPDLFHLRVQGVQRLVDEYGRTSAQVKHAMAMLEEMIDQMTEEFKRLYSDNLIIQVVTTPATDAKTSTNTLSRRARSLLQADDPAKNAQAESLETRLDVADIYTEMYPIIFNMMLWGGIAYALVILAISYGIWFMDPGKDSIIYRMTSTRKKDS